VTVTWSAFAMLKGCTETTLRSTIYASTICGIIAMTESAFCRMRLPAPGSLQLGSWALETSDRGGRGGQDKANWRSQTRRPSAVEKPLSAHWFLEARRLALSDVRSRPDGAFRVSRRISTSCAMALAIFNSIVSAFLRSLTRRCAFLRLTYNALARLGLDEDRQPHDDGSKRRI
jgi:hypothetical protein